MQPVLKSTKLANVCYDIRGPVLARARQMEEEGHRIIKLNIGNPAPFGFEAPEEIVVDVIHNLRDASGYSDSKGLFAARKAIMHYCQEKAIGGVGIDDIYILRIEQLYPVPLKALVHELARFKNAEVVWCQEEPRNMGAWHFIEPYLEWVLNQIHAPNRRPRYAGRAAAAATATGLMSKHLAQLKAFLDEALS